MTTYNDTTTNLNRYTPAIQDVLDDLGRKDYKDGTKALS